MQLVIFQVISEDIIDKVMVQKIQFIFFMVFLLGNVLGRKFKLCKLFQLYRGMVMKVLRRVFGQES